MKPRLGAGLSLFRSIAARRGAETGGGAILLEIYPTLRENLKFPFAKRRALDSTGQRIRDGFMDNLTVLRVAMPRKWRGYCGEGSDSFRVISPKDFRILG
jgi:hypothetical protein